MNRTYQVSMEEIFSEKGNLSNAFENYEFRPEQKEMADFIHERLYECENGLIEAGTGTGKTLAYLVPAVLFAMENHKRIIISTETKSLQNQLIMKDIPFVKKFFNTVYNHDFSFVVCLGSANYPCRSRYETAVMRGKLFPEDVEAISDIGSLFGEGKVFNRYDTFASDDLWSELQREPDACQYNKCRFFSRCIFQKAVREWQSADILIMNHYLLFSHLATDRSYLGNCDVIIFDEAHRMEEIASTQFGFAITLGQLRGILHKFHHDEKRSGTILISSKSAQNRINLQIKKIEDEGMAFFQSLKEMLRDGRNYQRMREQIESHQQLLSLLQEFMVTISNDDLVCSDDDSKTELDVARGKLFIYIETLNQYIAMNKENYVYWVEKSNDKSSLNVVMVAQPVDVAEILKKQVYDYYDSCIFVSATMAVDKDFSYTATRLGVTNYKTILLGSSFNYRKQMIVLIDRNGADPAGAFYNDTASKTASSIISHLNGNCLMLFTSYKMLREIKGLLQELVPHSIHSQEELNASGALHHYLDDDNSILLGTHSFWQGIDIPGDRLRGVIMMKLPFAVPDTPLMQARMESVTQKGYNPFMTLQLPEAVIKFRQGMGRLIRSQRDKGIFAILDSRILHKRYGKAFIQSLPECTVVYTIDDMIEGYSQLSGAVEV